MTKARVRSRSEAGILTPVAIAVWLGLAAGCGPPDPPVLTEQAGYPVYRKFCRRCHGAWGDGKRASRMAERELDFSNPAWPDTLERATLERIVRRGKGRMKGYEEKLTGEEIEQILDYVRSLSRLREPFRKEEENR